MLSIQAVRGLPRLRAPVIVPSIISFSLVSSWCDNEYASLPCFDGVMVAKFMHLFACCKILLPVVITLTPFLPQTASELR